MRVVVVVALALLAAGCTTLSSERVGREGGEDVPGDAEPTPAPSPDASVDTRVDLPPHEARVLDLMPPARLDMIGARLPRIADPALLAILESADTLWYDKLSIVPGYQDSFGHDFDCSTCGPIGMRPNSIAASMINLAVPGGHGQIFQQKGIFHFPFGRAPETGAQLAIVDFWHVPRGDDGELLPVVWWRRDPNQWTHRVEWMFPAGTVLGEVLFLVDGGEWFPFEVRTRRRLTDKWTVDVFRPFPTATDFADALEAKRTESAEWAAAADIQHLIDFAHNDETLVAATLSATNFPGSFPSISGAKDVLPGIADTEILGALLLSMPFRSAKGAVWKESSSGLRAWAATTNEPFSVVPKNWDAGFLNVDDATCSRCHRDAGRPFRDWYGNILAYGELWGEDETFSWHPFDDSYFVTATGDAKNFNWGSRVLRSDFVTSGLLAPYDDDLHPPATYRTLPGAWKNYSY